ncbi:hypothetical protein N7507_001603 [Penicillium longicatenatum]|nr:hypothetical protein N7507_001603 [Penicillium longicatenatum]
MRSYFAIEATVNISDPFLWNVQYDAMDLHLDHDDVPVNSPQAKALPSQDGQSNTHATLIASDYQITVAKSG